MSKKVAIIGAGASGLTAIKCCLDEQLEPVCFERTGEIGGLWNFKQEVHDGQACVSKSTVINTSKEMMCYSDFPIPKEYPIFMHNTLVQKYFNLYANNFNLKRHIRFNVEVLRVTPMADFEQSGRWEIAIRDNQTRKEEVLVFDAVMVCTGHHAMCHRPKFAGLDEFEGKVLHSHDYKDVSGYADKRVLIVGIGNSGGDAAVELSRVTSQVFLSTRRGSWVLNRVAEHGMPIDMLNTSRIRIGIMKLLPRSLIRKLVEHKLNSRFDHEAYSLKPKHPFFSQHPTVNDDLPNRLVCGSVKVKADVKRFTNNGVEFVDGTTEDNIDVVILATGYIFGFPFIDKSVIEVKENKVELFKYAFPPNLAKPTMVVVGCFQPLGAIMPICELQCRLATKLFKGEVSLPPKESMWNDIHLKQQQMALRYVQSQRHTIQVDFIPFMDELAELVGCKPDIWEVFKSDPKLGWACLVGPCTPYQYRLQGPGQWKGARDSIMTQWERTLYPLKTRPVDVTEKQSSSHIKLLIIIVLLAFIIHFLFFR